MVKNLTFRVVSRLEERGNAQFLRMWIRNLEISKIWCSISSVFTFHVANATPQIKLVSNKTIPADPNERH